MRQDGLVIGPYRSIRSIKGYITATVPVYYLKSSFYNIVSAQVRVHEWLSHYDIDAAHTLGKV